MQRFRKALLIISFVFFPVTLYYFSPALIIEAAVYGILAGSGIVFALQFITSLIFGRIFCGWFCPAAGLQEWSFGVNNKKVAQKYNNIKYIIWIIWMGLIVYLFIRAGGIKEVEFLYQNSNGISVDAAWKYIIYYIILFIFIVFSFAFGRRAFCHYLCWMAPFMVLGNRIRKIFNLPSLHISANDANCISCKKCNNCCPMSLEVNEMVKQGAIDNIECVLCGQCIDICPKDVLKFSFGRSSDRKNLPPPEPSKSVKRRQSS